MFPDIHYEMDNNFGNAVLSTSSALAGPSQHPR